MTRRPTVQEQFSKISTLTDSSDPKEVRRALVRGLRSRSAPLVEHAACTAVRLQLTDLVPEMESIFHRLIERPAHQDKGCRAKIAIVRALLDLEVNGEEVFLRSIRHVQREPAQGGPVDTAAELRGLGTHGLLAGNHPEALLLAVDLLVDPETMVRRETIRALANAGRVEAEPLLRLKALGSEPEIAVVEECLSALLQLKPQRSLPFVLRFLEDVRPRPAAAAARALGRSHLEGVEPHLLRAWRAAGSPELRRVLLRSLSEHRSEEALAHLFEQLKEGATDLAFEAVDALAIHHRDPELVARLRAVVEERGDDRITARLRRALETRRN
jgi:HEAT repeat protein